MVLQYYNLFIINFHLHFRDDLYFNLEFTSDFILFEINQNHNCKFF